LERVSGSAELLSVIKVVPSTRAPALLQLGCETIVRVLAPCMTRILNIGIVGPLGLAMPAVIYVHVVMLTFFVPGISQPVCAMTVASVLVVPVAVTVGLPVLTLIDRDPAAYATGVASKPRPSTKSQQQLGAIGARLRNVFSLLLCASKDLPGIHVLGRQHV
jgi:hypothetical protein